MKSRLEADTLVCSALQESSKSNWSISEFLFADFHGETYGVCSCIWDYFIFAFSVLVHFSGMSKCELSVKRD